MNQNERIAMFRRAVERAEQLEEGKVVMLGSVAREFLNLLEKAPSPDPDRVAE